jgi:membrane protein insertase Oxa1/YidC/SpoIIIJ
MANNVGKAYHPINGSTEDIWEGFSWPCFFFGLFWYLYKGLWGWAIISLCLALITFGISWLIFPFFANEHYAAALLKRCYLNEDQWNKKKQDISRTNSSKSQQNAAASVADELTKLSALKEQGIISEEEFEKQKRKLLS